MAGLAIVLCASLPAGVQAIAGQPQAQFSCRAAVLDAGGTQSVVANSAETPCLDGQASTAELPAGLVVLRGGSASTHQPSAVGGSVYREGDQAAATVTVGGVDFPAFGLSIDGIRAEASATCQGGQPVLAGMSTVGEVRVAGAPVPLVGGHVDLPLGVARLHLNETIRDGGRIIQRAVWVQSSLGDVIIGEATTGSTGLVCASAAITIVNGTPASFGQTFAFAGDLGTFLLPEQGSPPLNGQHVFAVAPGRYAVTESPSPSQAASWPLQGLTCTEGSGASTDLARRTVTVVVKPGDSVTCTFTNGPGGLGLSGAPSTVQVNPSLNPLAFDVKPRIETSPSSRPAVTPSAHATAAPAITPGTGGTGAPTATPGTGGTGPPTATPAPAGEALPATSGVSPAGGFSRLWLLLALAILGLILFVLFL
ncbi:MAG TPA: hypothetical protein VGK51_16115, partial [Actinomycetota bacterium]